MFTANGSSKVFYENYVGSIIDWYAATLFRREPELHIEGVATTRAKVLQRVRRRLRPEGHEPERLLPAAADRSAGLRRELHAGGFPEVCDPARHAGGRRLTGRSRAYLVDYPAGEPINWSHDARGNFEWVVSADRVSAEERAGRARSLRKRRLWRYYDRDDVPGLPARARSEKRRSN